MNLLLASIAFEELGLAHVINAEAEKLQAVLGTLPGVSLTATSISQLLSVNQSINRTLQTVLKTQMLLQFKLEDIKDIPDSTPTPTPTPPPPPPPPPPPSLQTGPRDITLVAGSVILAPNGVTALSGKVVDLLGQPVPNAQVVVTTDAGTIAPSIVTTDMNGDYGTTFTAPGSIGGIVTYAAVKDTTIVASVNLIVV